VFHGGVAISDQILDVAAASASGAFPADAASAVQAAAGNTFNALIALGQPPWSAPRFALSRALREGSADQATLQCAGPAHPHHRGRGQRVRAVPAQ